MTQRCWRQVRTLLYNSRAKKAGMKKLNKLLIPLIILAVATLPCCNDSPDSSNNTPKAAIIDQLYLLEPNQEFIDEVK